MPHPSSAAGSPRRRASAIPQLPDRWPAVAVTPNLDVVAANDRWTALHAPFAEQRNLARAVFLDPAATDFFVHRRHEEHDAVAWLNEAAREQEGDDAATALLDELSAASPRCAELRSGPLVRPLRRDRYVVRHPHLGVLHFTRRSRREGRHIVRVAVPSADADAALGLLDLI